MFLSRLRLHNFRNYEKLDLGLSPGLTVLEGDNGQGKTNLLEAVYFLSLLRSFRTSKVTQLRRLETPGFFLEGTLKKTGSWLNTDKIAVSHAGQRRLRVNHRTVVRASDFINSFLVVAMTPHDLELVRGPPNSRRRFGNILTAQMEPGFVTDLIQYTIALRNRNAALRQPAKYGSASLQVYDRLLVNHGIAIIRARQRQVARLNQFLRPIISGLGEHDDSIEIRYLADLGGRIGIRPDDDRKPAEMAALFFDLLQREQRKDTEQGTTRYGPHRDDLGFFRHHQPLAAFASEGQIRLFVIALHLAAASMAVQVAESKPVILLVDDIFSDLDQERRGRFFQLLAGYRQTLLTCTMKPAELRQMEHFTLQVRNGTVTAAGQSE